MSKAMERAESNRPSDTGRNSRTVPDIRARKGRARIVASTVYDFAFARLLDTTDVDILLVGDSVGTVVQGHSTTLPVTLDEMIYHCRAVCRGATRALVVADLPFMTYQLSPTQALESAGRLVKESGAQAVKLEGGATIEESIRKIVSADIPVVGHLGLTPQSVHRMGGHRVQGREESGPGSRVTLLDDARRVEDAGAFALVLEGVPASLAQEITAAVSIPTIGIGAGRHCDGQVLVLYDLLGLCPWISPKFVKRYLNGAELVQNAVGSYVEEVRSGAFPSEAYEYGGK